MKKLRPHQADTIKLVREQMGRGNKWVCIVIPTGGGKTVLGAHMALQHLTKSPKGRVLWVCHREELVSQSFDTFEQMGLSSGVIQSTPSRTVNPYRPVQIASIQTLVARNVVVDGTSMFMYDECHHSMSDGWGKLALSYKQRGIYGIGLTATPIRADDLPLGDIYDALICPISMAELIEQGYLVPYDLIRPRSPLRKQQIAQRPVDAWSEHAPDRKTLVFAANIPAATLFRDQFRAEGVAAELVTGDMDAAERRDVLLRYKLGKIKVLCNVGVLTEGFDDPSTSCVIIARGVGSVGLYLQICGRALRTSPETGKTSAILIDLYGSSWKHGAPDEDREFTLDGDGIRRKKLEQAPERFCLLCGVTLEGGATVCLECGSESAGSRMPEVVNAALVKYAKMRKFEEPKRIDSLRRWVADCAANGWKVGRAYHKYRTVFGDWPPPHIKRAIQD